MAPQKTVMRIQASDEEARRMQDYALPTMNAALKCLLLGGQLSDEVLLQPGLNTVDHKLGRAFIGWFVVTPKQPAMIYADSMQDVNSSGSPTKPLFANIYSDVQTACRFWFF